MELESALKVGTALPVRQEGPFHEPATGNRLDIERQPHGSPEPGFIQHAIESYNNADLPVENWPVTIFMIDISYQVRGRDRYPFRYSIFAINSPSTSGN